MPVLATVHEEIIAPGGEVIDLRDRLRATEYAFRPLPPATEETRRDHWAAGPVNYTPPPALPADGYLLYDDPVTIRARLGRLSAISADRQPYLKLVLQYGNTEIVYQDVQLTRPPTNRITLRQAKSEGRFICFRFWFPDQPQSRGYALVAMATRMPQWPPPL